MFQKFIHNSKINSINNNQLENILKKQNAIQNCDNICKASGISK